MRFDFDERKSRRLRANPKRAIGFEEAQQLFTRPYYLDQRSDAPEQYRAIGWVRGHIYSVIFEMREDERKANTITSSPLEGNHTGTKTL
jgi:uncharacterized DUF497 family protein